MTIHIQMLQDIATHARAMADSMQAIVDDSCVGFAGFPRRWVRFGWEPSQPSSGGAVVKAAVRVSSGVPPFLFPFGLSARRRAERFGRWGHPESLLEQADWGGVAGAGVRAGGAKTGSRSRSLGGAAAGRPGFRGGGLFPRRQRQFRSGRAKKQATKRRTKKDFPSPKRRRFVKTGFFARYKEARRSGRPRGRKSPARAKATVVVGFRASP